MELLCAIYKILKEESNEEETLARSAIERKLKEKYSDVKTGHKMVRDRLNAICNFEMNLPDDQKTIRYKEGEYIKNKGKKDEKKFLRRRDYYYNNSITDLEYKFLIDSIMNTKIFPPKTAIEFGKKIQRLSGRKQKDYTPYVNESYGETRCISDKDEINVLDNCLKIMKAIEESYFIKFNWNLYDVSNQKVILNSKGERCIKPMKLLLNNGRYYVLCRHLNSEKIYAYSVDLMSGIEKVENINEKKEISINAAGIEIGFKRAEYIHTHPYNMTGELNRYNLSVERNKFSRVVEIFSNEIKIKEEKDNIIDISVMSSVKGMEKFILQNSDIIENISGDSELKKDLKQAIYKLIMLYIHM